MQDYAELLADDAFWRENEPSFKTKHAPSGSNWHDERCSCPTCQPDEPDGYEVVSQIGQVKLVALSIDVHVVEYVDERGKVITSPIYLNYSQAVAVFARRVEEADR